MRNPQEQAVAEIATSLDRLARLPVATQKIHTLIAHSRLIVDLLPTVDHALNQLLNAPIIQQIQALRVTYLNHYSQVGARARVFRFLLYLVAVALLVYLILLFARLRAHAQALASRLSFEDLITEISTQFINLPPGAVDKGINDALERLGEHAQVDRCYIVLFNADGARMDTTHAWYRAGIDAPIDPLMDLPIAKFSWGLDSLKRHGWVYVPRVSEMPVEAVAEEAVLEARRIRSFLSVSLQYTGKLVGFLGFSSVRDEKSWSNDDIALLRIAGEIFANALGRKWAETKRETLEAQLRQSQKLEALGTLAGGIAHDFNNILGAILGYGEMALTALPEGRPRHHVQQVMTAGQRAKALVDQILTFSRRGSSKRQPTLMQPLIKETLDLIRASLPTTLAIQVRLQAEDAIVLGDTTQLQQVVMNLCTNAAQAMQGSGTLDIALDTAEIAQELTLFHGSLAAGRYVRLTVSDTGRGMDEVTLTRIFDPFFTTKEAGNGTGLGLSLVHGIVADHNGAINIQTHPGKGSTFEVYFPCCVAPAISATEAETPLPQGNGETIMLVDDEPPLVALGEEMLAALGYEPVGFTSSRQALNCFRADPQRFDVVLTDEVMPELTGTRLAAQLHPLRPELPILLMTGYSSAVLSPPTREAGIRELLKKPLQLRDLAESIARQLPAKA
jgi:signal transduction histidine kinase/CheY-like chemotaxis protein